MSAGCVDRAQRMLKGIKVDRDAALAQRKHEAYAALMALGRSLEGKRLSCDVCGRTWRLEDFPLECRSVKCPFSCS